MPHRMRGHVVTARRDAMLVMASVWVFALVCALAQFWRQDLDPLAKPLSAYLLGPGGAYVRAAYYVLAGGIVVFGLASFRVTPRPARSVVPALLFVVAGAALVPVAVSYSDELFAERTPLLDLVHGLAAQTTFLCITVAMLLQSWRWHRVEPFRRGSARLMTLAVAASIALWTHVLTPGLSRGAMQKLVIVLILLWLAVAATRLLRTRAYAGL